MPRPLELADRARNAPAAVVRPRRIPLSFSQQRFWFLNELYGPNAIFNVPIALKIVGALDREALRAAFGDIVRRHESLRTVFEHEAGSPCQKILHPGQLPLHCEFTQLPPDIPAATAADVAHCFDLAREAPIRVSVYRTDDSTHVLVIVVHHSAIDAWSVNILLRDLITAYSARLQQRAPEFRPLPLQYADYAIWNRAHLGDAEDPCSTLARQLNFWRRTLEDLPTRLSLPTDRPRPAAETF